MRALGRELSAFLPSLALLAGIACGDGPGGAVGDGSSGGSTGVATTQGATTTTTAATTSVTSEAGSTGATGSTADSGGSSDTGGPPPCVGDDDCPAHTVCNLETGACVCDPARTLCLEDVPAGHWLELQGTAMADVLPPQDTVPGSRAAIVTAWSGGVYDRDRNRMVVWGGGHADYAGNEVYAFDLEALAWTRLGDPSLDVGGDEASGYYPDGRPRSRHTYDYLAYVPELGAMCSVGGAGLWMSGQINVDNLDCYDFATGQWSARSPAPEGTIAGIADYDAATGRIAYVLGPQLRYLATYDVAADSWTTHGDNFTNGGLGHQLTGRVHPSARRFVAVGGATIYSWDLDAAGAVQEQALALANPPPGFDRSNPGLDYDVVLDRLVWWGGGRSLWSIDLDAMAWVEHPAAADDATVPPEPIANGTYGRFRYALAEDLFVLVSAIDQNVFVRRL